MSSEKFEAEETTIIPFDERAPHVRYAAYRASAEAVDLIGRELDALIERLTDVRMLDGIDSDDEREAAVFAVESYLVDAQRRITRVRDECIDRAVATQAESGFCRWKSR
jgi:hypothetical protein